MNEKGFSLLEIAFCVAIVGILVLAIAGLEHAASTARQLNIRSAPRSQAVGALTQLVQDIHRAETAESVSPGRLVLAMGGRRVEWVSGKDRIDRTDRDRRQSWQAKGGVRFRETHQRSIEIYFPGPAMYSYAGLGIGAR